MATRHPASIQRSCSWVSEGASYPPATAAMRLLNPLLQEWKDERKGDCVLEHAAKADILSRVYDKDTKVQIRVRVHRAFSTRFSLSQGGATDPSYRLSCGTVQRTQQSIPWASRSQRSPASCTLSTCRCVTRRVRCPSTSNASQDTYNAPITKFIAIVMDCLRENPDIHFEVLVHKAESLPEDYRIGKPPRPRSHRVHDSRARHREFPCHPESLKRRARGPRHRPARAAPRLPPYVHIRPLAVGSVLAHRPTQFRSRLSRGMPQLILRSALLLLVNSTRCSVLTHPVELADPKSLHIRHRDANIPRHRLLARRPSRLRARLGLCTHPPPTHASLQPARQASTSFTRRMEHKRRPAQLEHNEHRHRILAGQHVRAALLFEHER